MHVSVVIPTFNRAALLLQTLPALLHQLVRGFTYEIIFVSNGSTDQTAEILSENEKQFPQRIRYFRIEPTGNPSAPRNFGIRKATGDVLIILDDDVLPDPDLVLRHVEFHLAYPALHHAALGEAYVPAHLLQDPMSLFHHFPYDEIRNLDRLSYLHFWTCNVSVKRKFMLEAGMFDEQFLMYEDMICGHRLATQGMHLHFLPAARGQHLHQLKAPDLPAKGLHYGRWLYPFAIDRLPERAVKERFGILSPDIGFATLAKRLVRRLGFRLADNPLTMACLKALGATGPKRSRFSDFYYFIIFRRNLLAGYYQAKREAKLHGHPPSARVRASSPNQGK